VIDRPPEHSANPSPLDVALKEMVEGHIVFNNPEKMRVGDTGEVEAVLAVNVPVDDLLKQLTAAGKQEEASLLVSDHMRATLSGGGAFDVDPIGPQTQWISQQKTTIWHWLVTPKLQGTQFLILTVDAIITINGEKDTRTITTLKRKIEVEVRQTVEREFVSVQHDSKLDDSKWVLEWLAAFVIVVGGIGAAIDKRHEIGSWSRKYFQRIPKQPTSPPNLDIPDEDRD
jgi:hypothetical protein